MSAHSGPNLVEDGLVLYLDAANPQSYPGTGTTWYDLSKFSNHGILENGVLYSSDNGGIMSFDGVNDRVNCGNSNSLKITEEITLISWFKTSAQTNGGLIDTQSNASYGYRLIIEAQGLVDLELGIYGANVGAGYRELNSTLNPADGNWHQGAGTWDGLNMKLFIDGILNNTAQQSAMAATSQNLYIGVTDVTVGFINGFISNAFVYNRALSEQEIKQNYHALKSRYT